MTTTYAPKDELRNLVGKLIRDQFGGDLHKAFDHYDGDVKDGRISRQQLIKLLGDAGVGNWLIRGAWASGIIAELDTDGDGRISEVEFGAVLRA